MQRLETFTDSAFINQGIIDVKALNKSGEKLTEKIEAWADKKYKEAIRNKTTFSYRVINVTQIQTNSAVVTSAFVGYEG